MTQNIPIRLCLSFFVQKCPVLTTLVLHFFECSSRILPYSFGKKVLFPKKTKRRVKENWWLNICFKIFLVAERSRSHRFKKINIISAFVNFVRRPSVCAQASGVVIINISYKSLKICYFFRKFRVSIK